MFTITPVSLIVPTDTPQTLRCVHVTDVFSRSTSIIILALLLVQPKLFPTPLSMNANPAISVVISVLIPATRRAHIALKDFFSMQDSAVLAALLQNMRILVQEFVNYANRHVTHAAS